MSAADENENENEERRMLLLIRERKREKREKQKTSKKSKKKKKRLFSFWFVCKLFRWCFLLAQKKKTRAERQTHENAKELLFVRSSNDFLQKKQKKEKKEEKRISLPHNTFLE